MGPTATFDPPISCSNLVAPNVEAVLEYSRAFFDAHHFTNNGPVARRLEQRLAEFHGTERCLVFSSGYWALVLAIKTLAVAGRDEVVLPSFTYRREADIVAAAGLVPRFCDVDPQTLAISAESAEPAMGPATALLLGLHPIVNCCDVDGLERLAAEHGVPLLMDSIESCYESYKGRRVGSFGRAEVFSLHASKLLNGFEGGYITTNDHELADRLALIRGFGFQDRDTVLFLGTNAKLNEVHASMALASLDDIDQQVLRNRDRYRAYQKGLASLPGIRLLEFDETERCGFKNIVVELTEVWPLDRDETVRLLNAEGALARAYYAPALHTKSYGFETRAEAMPVTEAFASRFLLLPSGARVTEADINVLISLLRRFATEARARGALS